MITGATGFVGRHIVRAFVARGHDVVGVSLHGGTVDELEVKAVDCENWPGVLGVFANGPYDAVVHSAARISSYAYGDEALRTVTPNLKMTMNVIEGLRMWPGTRLIYLSTSSVYGTPDNVDVDENSSIRPEGAYPLGKYFGELLCDLYRREYGGRVSILRISAPYGPEMRRETVVGKFIRHALKGKDLVLFASGARSQDFTYVGDVAEGVVGDFEAEADGIFNISSGTVTTMRRLAETIVGSIRGCRSQICTSRTVDMADDRFKIRVSHERATGAWGYKPRYTLKDGVEEYVQWIRRGI